MNQYPYTLTITNTHTRHTWSEVFPTRGDRARRIEWLAARGHYTWSETTRRA